MGKGYRKDRLGEEIKKIVSMMLLREIKDPRLANSMVSVSDVEVTSDGSYATCFITVLSTTKDEELVEKEENEVLEGLKSAKGLIKKEIGRQVKLRHIPELIFKIDRSMEYGRHITNVINKLGTKDEK